MKKTLILISSILVTSSLYAECSKKQIAQMIMNDVPQEQINGTCATQAYINTNQTTENYLPAQWREKEVDGLGFGISAYGLQLFYDHNLNKDLQLHISYNQNIIEQKDFLDTVIISTEARRYLAAIRYFPDDFSGFFIGAGTGYGKTTQNYHYDSTATSSKSYIPVFAELGWQGWDGYYFTVNLNKGVNYNLSKDNNVENIDYSYYRQKAQKDYETMNSNTGIGILFGWYL